MSVADPNDPLHMIGYPPLQQKMASLSMYPAGGVANSREDFGEAGQILPNDSQQLMNNSNSASFGTNFNPFANNGLKFKPMDARGSPQRETHLDAPRGTKIFVGGLQCTQEEFERYWSQIDGVVNVAMIKTADTKQSRGFGFVVFDSPQRVEMVLQVQHCISGKMADCKVAIPRHQLPPSPYALNNYTTSGGRGMGGMMGGGHNHQHNNHMHSVDALLACADPDLAFLESEAQFLQSQISNTRNELSTLETRLRMATNLIKMKTSSHRQQASGGGHDNGQNSGRSSYSNPRNGNSHGRNDYSPPSNSSMQQGVANNFSSVPPNTSSTFIEPRGSHNQFQSQNPNHIQQDQSKQMQLGKQNNSQVQGGGLQWQQLLLSQQIQ